VIEKLPLDLRLIRGSRDRGNGKREKYKARFHT
jgi:hypothetical protein